MRRRELKACIPEALALLPGHVAKYIRENVTMEIDTLGWGFDKDIDWSHCIDGGFGTFDDGTKPHIAIDRRVKTKRRAVRVVLHEVGHAWLTFRGLKDTEKRANILARSWLKRGKEA